MPNEHPIIVRLENESFKNQVVRALPKQLELERFVRIIRTAMMSDSKLLGCSDVSIFDCIHRAAALGLEPNTPLHLCYLIPRGGHATLQLGYRGLSKLAKNNGEVSQIWPCEVRERDDFRVYEGTERKIHHIPLDPREGDRGDLVASYAVARLADGEKQFHVCYPSDIERIRSCAQTQNVWEKHPGPMWMKSAIKQLCKYLDLSPEAREEIHRDDMSEIGRIEVDHASHKRAMEMVPMLENKPAEPEPEHTDDDIMAVWENNQAKVPQEGPGKAESVGSGDNTPQPTPDPEGDLFDGSMVPEGEGVPADGFTGDPK